LPKFQKVGGVPFYFDANKRLMMLFMIPSDSSKDQVPNIAKGHVDNNETEYETLFREVREELGLKKGYVNKFFRCFPLKNQQIPEKWNSLTVFAMELKTLPPLTKTDPETQKVVWLNEVQITENFREDQRYIIDEIVKEIKKKYNK
jgi:8-oxo-dGTP pyrophosphatase MutT (NUDIX family)